MHLMSHTVINTQIAVMLVKSPLLILYVQSISIIKYTIRIRLPEDNQIVDHILRSK